MRRARCKEHPNDSQRDFHCGHIQLLKRGSSGPRTAVSRCSRRYSGTSATRRIENCHFVFVSSTEQGQVAGKILHHSETTQRKTLQAKTMMRSDSLFCSFKLMTVDGRREIRASRGANPFRRGAASTRRDLRAQRDDGMTHDPRILEVCNTLESICK